MYRRDTRVDPAIDSVVCVSGEFTLSGDPTNPDVAMEVTMAYFDSETGLTLGSCVVPQDSMSAETMQAFKTFLDMAENDFGDLAFNRSYAATPEPAQPIGVGSGMADLTKR